MRMEHDQTGEDGNPNQSNGEKSGFIFSIPHNSAVEIPSSSAFSLPCLISYRVISVSTIGARGANVHRLNK